MHALEGPKLKLATAKEQIDKLHASVSRFITDKEVQRVSFDRDPDTGEEVHIAHVSQPPDPAWGVHVGTIAHLLRSALDNLAWQLALLNTATPYERTTYPIYLKRRGTRSYETAALNIVKNGSNKGRLRGTLQYVASRHRAMIERTQPYRRDNGNEKDPLWLLAQLNNTEKHRMIPVVVMTCQRMHAVPVIRQKPFFIGFHVTVRGGLAFEDGAELARFPGPVKVKPKYSTQIFFAQGCPDVERLPVFDTLMSMHGRVANIVSGFDNEF